MASDESKFEEFKEVILEKLDMNDLSKEEAYAFYGYFYAMMDYEIVSYEEFRALRVMLPLSSDDINGFAF